MAHEIVDPSGVMTVRYSGTDLGAADSNNGQVVRVTAGTGQPSDYGWGRPTVAKLPAGDATAVGDLLGVVQTVEVPSSGSRAPSGTRIASVATKGVLKTKKTSAPVLADIGLAIVQDTAGTKTDGGVTTAAATAATPRGIVVGITGLTADDFLIVDWR